MDENMIMMSPEWGLPTPNQEAAYKSLSKYAKDILPMSEEQVKAMNMAWEWTAQHFGPYMGGARVRTVQEVIPDLDKDTSSGYPFNAFFPKKKDLFEGCPEIVEWFEADWDNLLDEHYTFMFTNSLKEEIRPEVKTKANKIRTFTAGAVDGTVHGNRLFADMNEKMNSSFLQSSSGVGMSPLKGNWDRLYRKLNMFRKGYALDESEYDSSLRSYMMWGCAKLRWQMLREEDRTPENLKRIKNYYRNLVNSLVITPEGVIVLKLGGNPSGSVNTINDNTLILYTLLAYAWIMNCGEDPKQLEFELNTSKVLVGDDNTWTVSDWAHEFFNARTVIVTWNKIGVTTTTDDLEPRSAKDLDFLSAKTIFYLGRAIPVYDREKLMTSLLFAETKKQSPAFTLLRAAALLSVGWSDTQFRKFCREFIAWLIENFDEVCNQDPDWIQAKCGILSDERLAKLFLGDEILYQQSVESCSCAQPWKPWHKKCNYCQELEERSIKPDKRMNGQMPSKKNSNRKQRGGKKGAAKKQAQATRSNPKPRQRNRGARRRGGNTAMAFNRGPANSLAPRQRQAGMNISKTQVVNEHEEILDIIGNGTNFGVVNTLALNPGQALSFPTLSVQAKIWQRYRFRSLRYEYQPTVSEFATAGTTGKVIFTVNPDAADGPPSTKVSAFATDKDLVASALPCRGFSVNIPPRKLMPIGRDWRFVRPGNLPGAADVREYDVGNLFICTTGTNDNTTKLGELHVYYTIDFETMINTTIESAPTNNSVSMFQSAVVQTNLTTVATTQLVATATFNGLNIVNTAGSMVPPVGNYLVSATSVMADSNSEQFSGVLDLLKNGTGAVLNVDAPSFQITAGASKQTLTFLAMVTANGTDAFTISVTETGAAGALTAATVVVWTAI